MARLETSGIEGFHNFAAVLTRYAKNQSLLAWSQPFVMGNHVPGKLGNAGLRLCRHELAHADVYAAHIHAGRRE